MKTTTRKRGNYVYTYEVLRYEYSPKLRHSIAILGKQVERRYVGRSIVNGMCRFCRRATAIHEEIAGKIHSTIISIQKQCKSLERKTKLGLDDKILYDDDAFLNYLNAIGTNDEMSAFNAYKLYRQRFLEQIHEIQREYETEIKNVTNVTI